MSYVIPAMFLVAILIPAVTNGHEVQKSQSELSFVSKYSISAERFTGENIAFKSLPEDAPEPYALKGRCLVEIRSEGAMCTLCKGAVRSISVEREVDGKRVKSEAQIGNPVLELRASEGVMVCEVYVYRSARSNEGPHSTQFTRFTIDRKVFKKEDPAFPFLRKLYSTRGFIEAQELKIKEASKSAKWIEGLKSDDT